MGLSEVLDWIQTQYPGFWKVVFADLEEGLDGLFKASWFMVAAAIFLLLYSTCECCCCPYRKGNVDEEDEEDAHLKFPACLFQVEKDPQFDNFDWSIPEPGSDSLFPEGQPRVLVVRISHGHYSEQEISHGHYFEQEALEPRDGLVLV